MNVKKIINPYETSMFKLFFLLINEMIHSHLACLRKNIFFWPLYEGYSYQGSDALLQ
jgi:hypothetical protein